MFLDIAQYAAANEENRIIKMNFDRVTAKDHNSYESKTR